MRIFRHAIDSSYFALRCRVSDPLAVGRPRRLVLTTSGRRDLTNLSVQVNCEDVGIIVGIRIHFAIGEESDFVSTWTGCDR